VSRQALVIYSIKKQNMFANPTNVGISQRVVATLVACAVLLASIGLYSITTAHAANLVDVSDVLSDSYLNVASNHTITFTMSSTGSVAAGGTITVTFPAGFNMNSIAFEDVDLKIAGTDQTLAATPSGATWGVGLSGQVLTLTSGTGTVTSGQTVEIQIGTNATFANGTGNTQITNPNATGSVELYITAGTSDTGRTRVAIIDNVTVSAIVDTSFTFTITGMATSTAVNGLTTTGSTSPTTINFGRIIAGSGNAEVLSQRLNVTTNANSGFTVTVAQDSNLQSSNGSDIDSFIQGAYTNIPALWPTLTTNISDENTWGHWGLTSSDDINASEFSTGGTKFVAASTTPRAIFSHTGSADGTTANIGSTTVGYKIEISPLQEAADDYTTVLTYVATPTF
jgi:hypothetical protein